MLKIDFPKETFDGIWAQAVLLHLKRKDLPKALKKFHKILKKNGVLHFTLREGKGEAYVRDEISNDEKRFYTYFSRSEIKNLLKKQGFKIILFKVTGDVHKRADIHWIRIWAKK